MLHGKSCICIIPARGGSKGIKNKNLRIVATRPLIYWVIKAAKDSGIHDRIIVSTDNIRIADVARRYNVEVQSRPKRLAEDRVSVLDVLPYVLKKIEKQDKRYDYVQLLEPTAPLITGIDILKAARRFHYKKADALISVCESKAPLGISAPIPDDRSLKGWFPKELRRKCRRQTKTTYQLDGNIYFAKWDVFADGKDYWELDTYAYIMPDNKYVDVDNEIDLVLADNILTNRYENKSFLARLFGM